MQKTDERILNTYKKAPTSKPKRKSSTTESTGRRVAYDVIYPAIGELIAPHIGGIIRLLYI